MGLCLTNEYKDNGMIWKSCICVFLVFASEQAYTIPFLALFGPMEWIHTGPVRICSSAKHWPQSTGPSAHLALIPIPLGLRVGWPYPTLPEINLHGLNKGVSAGFSSLSRQPSMLVCVCCDGYFECLTEVRQGG